MFVDHPYMVLKAVRYDCHHGPDRNAAKKEKAKHKVCCQLDLSSTTYKLYRVSSKKSMTHWETFLSRCPQILLGYPLIRISTVSSESVIPRL